MVVNFNLALRIYWMYRCFFCERTNPEVGLIDHILTGLWWMCNTVCVTSGQCGVLCETHCVVFWPESSILLQVPLMVLHNNESRLWGLHILQSCVCVCVMQWFQRGTVNMVSISSFFAPRSLLELEMCVAVCSEEAKFPFSSSLVSILMWSKSFKVYPKNI